MLIFALYVTIFIVAYVVYGFVVKRLHAKNLITENKTVTFGDASTVTANRTASVLSVITLFVIWAAFTGSKLLPIHVPGPFIGDTTFTYTATNVQNQTDEGLVIVRVRPIGEDVKLPDVSTELVTGFIKDDAMKVAAWRSGLIRVQNNDEGGKLKGYQVTAINGQEIAPGQFIEVADGVVGMTTKGSLSFAPDKGWQMEPIWLPAPEAVFTRLLDITKNGYQNISLMQNVGWSLLRVIAGFLLGCIGIPRPHH